MAKILIEYEVVDCSNCPFCHYHYGHGECWYECTHKENGRGTYENVLWGCQEEFTSIPIWCPIFED